MAPLYADTKRFPHDTVDGETVIIDTIRGHLFLLTGLGPWIWSRMIGGNTPEGLAGEVAARFGDEAGAHSATFLGVLVQHGMLTEEAPVHGTEGSVLSMPTTFVAPQLEKYDEISDIIAMDPIHDVDPTKGWPHR